MSRLTIIIPLFRDTPVEAFEETLASVLVHRPKDTEILIANGTEYADPWNTAADGVSFLDLRLNSRRPDLRQRSNPVDTLNQALRHAGGPVIGILWPGTEMTADWYETSLDRFDDPKIGIVIPSVFDRRKPKRVFSFGIHYKSEGVLRTIRRSHWSEASNQTIVPHISAVFFRTEAVSNSNYLDRTFIPQIAYVDLAMAVAEQGWKTVVDQESRILVRPNQLPATSPFTWGMQVERLYFRWFGENGSIFTLGGHFGSFLADFARHFPRLKAFELLLGRMFGLLFFGEILPFGRRFHKKALRSEEPVKESASPLAPMACREPNQSDPPSTRKSA